MTANELCPYVTRAETGCRRGKDWRVVPPIVKAGCKPHVLIAARAQRGVVELVHIKTYRTEKLTPRPVQRRSAFVVPTSRDEALAILPRVKNFAEWQQVFVAVCRSEPRWCQFISTDLLFGALCGANRRLKETRPAAEVARYCHSVITDLGKLPPIDRTPTSSSPHVRRRK